ncbi:MAG: hypothetical protein PHR84_05905 [Candidatus Omnitrophica bacterium]|jgi:hypothetical protein|nr:hypothetical protein [Candidatus Omnitrophota bacterium]MDD5661212.1 hypothetical protein [Candidatus Omnitrophota bacterium]
MNIEVYALCDAATNDFGKLNMLGAFDTIAAKDLPAVHPQCAIAMRIRFESIEKGEHKVTVTFVDFDGRDILNPAHAAINVNIPEGQRSGSANLIINIQRLKLDKYGEYSIDLAIDGRREGSLPLFVVKAK